jgi:hypothetical protein
MKSVITALVIASAAMLGAGSALAADDGAQPVGKAACKADAQKLCPGVKPGEGRIAACLKEHRAEVSPACKAAAKKMHAKGAVNKE